MCNKEQVNPSKHEYIFDFSAVDTATGSGTVQEIDAYSKAEDAFKASSTSLIGLFWLEKDLSDFALFHADKEVTDFDLARNEDIFPDVSHRGAWPTVKHRIPNSNGLKFNSFPRGRVEYSAKEKCFVVKTGNWLTEDLKTKIIERYNLRNKPVRFDQNPFWDSR